MARAAAEFGITILAWVLLSNHLHAELQSPSLELYRRLTGRRTRCRHFRPWPPNHQNSTVLGQFMRVVRRTMSVTRQEELEINGRFWEAAYDARPINNAFSLVVRIAYDHRNPIKAGMVQRPEDYIWSSAREWATGQKGPVPLILPDPLPFGLQLDGLREQVIRYQRMRRLDDVSGELKQLLHRGVDEEAIREFLEEHGIPAKCGFRAATRSRSSL